MKKYGYEAANVRRWTLILLNFILLAGSAFPVIVRYGSAYSPGWMFDSSYYLGISREFLDNGALLSVLRILFLLMGTFGCGLHLLKLFGLFGEAKRNSRFVSILLSEVTLAGVTGVPVVETVRCCQGYSKYSFKTVHPSAWAFIAIGIGVWMIMLSMQLSATKPVFRSLARNYSENGIMDIALDENALNDERSEHPELDAVYEKNNIRRWLIFLLAVIMFLGLSIPVSGLENIGAVAEGLFYEGVVMTAISPGVGVLCLLAYLLILCGSAAQVMKLMGLFGDDFRNDRSISVLLAVAQAAGLVLLAVGGLVSLKAVNGAFTLKMWLKSWSLGFYVLLASAVLQTALAYKLTWTRPVIQGPSVKPPKDRQIQKSND
ncbi:MAG: hypothetical protein J5643_07820 [Lachnospiraceae bacterium]|nr:hypothetical protein [Lachnospiraceae bacterium]